MKNVYQIDIKISINKMVPTPAQHQEIVRVCTCVTAFIFGAAIAIVIIINF